MSIPDTYKVEQIPASETKEWLLKKHYAHRIPSISFAFGLYDKDSILQGVCTFGMPPSPDVCLLFGEVYKDKLLELNRLCVNDRHPKNTTSYFVSKCLDLLPRNMIIISYADSGQNHHGYIYQATNWIYTGLTGKQYDLKIKGTNKHSRHVYDNPDVETERVERTQKHRYFMFLGNKKEKKNMLSLLKYPILPYPKGDNIRYDASYQPNTQSILF